MIKVLMLDLGETLLHGETPFPHVTEALTAFNGFTTAAGAPLAVCLASDFEMAASPVTPNKISVIFKKYLKILERAQLRQFFEPVAKRVTLSTHAGVLKPDRRVFETAVKRLGAVAQLSGQAH